MIIKTSRILFKGGTNFPGKVALKIDMEILKTVAKGYKVIIVTGTNGKTTTTSMLYNIIKDNDKKVITNSTGANLLPGIVSCFIQNYSFKKISEERYAVIETDEANLQLVTKYISPEIITVTNLFRDQLDRFGEVYTTLKKIMEGIEKVPEATLILNGDESLLGDLLCVPNKAVYFGFDCAVDKETKYEVDINADAKFCKKCKGPYKYNYITYNHLGDYYCENCGYKRPELNFSINKIIEQTQDGSLVAIDGKEYYINQPGTYNIYNALCAYSVACTLGISTSIIFNVLKSVKSSFGRQEAIVIEGKIVKIILIKNPAGCDEAISTICLDNNIINTAILLNDNYADGRDVSWIWDAKFEKLKNLKIDKVMVGGTRLYDIASRLKIAGLDENNFAFCEGYEELIKEIKNCKDHTIYILATYTAMTSLRKYLNIKGYIKNLW